MRVGEDGEDGEGRGLLIYVLSVSYYFVLSRLTALARTFFFFFFFCNLFFVGHAGRGVHDVSNSYS